MKLLVNYDYGTLGTAYYFERAAKRLGHEVIRLGENTDNLDVVINIEPIGRIFKAPDVPCFYWECDSFIRKALPENEGAIDKLFLGGAPEDKYYFRRDAIFLPHAADKELHVPHPEVEKEFDLVMIGSMTNEYIERARLVDLLKTKFNVHVSRADPGVAYAQALSQGEIIFNRSYTDWNIPMRFFEGMAVGALLTNFHPNLDDLAEPYKHYIPYTSDYEMMENVEYFLKHPKELEEIRQNARKLVLDKHLYEHRVERMLQEL